jgi:hypothetical protein
LAFGVRRLAFGGCGEKFGSALNGRAKTSALLSLCSFVLQSPCAGFEPIVRIHLAGPAYTGFDLAFVASDRIAENRPSSANQEFSAPTSKDRANAWTWLKPGAWGQQHQGGAAIQSAEAAFASFGAPEGFKTCTSHNAAAT